MANNITIVPGLSLTVTNNTISSGTIPTNIILPGNVNYVAQNSAWFEFFPINNTLSQGPGFVIFPVVTNLPILYVRNIDATAVATLSVTQIGGAPTITIPLTPGGFLFMFNPGNARNAGVAVGGVSILSSISNSYVEIFYAV